MFPVRVTLSATSKWQSITVLCLWEWRCLPSWNDILWHFMTLSVRVTLSATSVAMLLWMTHAMLLWMTHMSCLQSHSSQYVHIAHPGGQRPLQSLPRKRTSNNALRDDICMALLLVWHRHTNIALTGMAQIWHRWKMCLTEKHRKDCDICLSRKSTTSVMTVALQRLWHIYIQ